MPDTYAIDPYHRRPVTPLGTSTKKKYLRVFLSILFAAAAGFVFLAFSSGFLIGDNPEIPGQMVERINSERMANGLPPVRISDVLTDDAGSISRETGMLPRGYQPPAGTKGAGASNTLVVPKVSWAISGFDAGQQMFTRLVSDDRLFRENVLNPSYDSVGIGVTGDSYNYYIVTSWA